MPCMGPDLDFAHRKGCEIGAKLLEQLIKEHRLMDIDNPKYEKMFNLPGAQERWKKAKQDFINAVGFIFEEDSSNGF